MGPTVSTGDGAVRGSVRWWLRLEGLLVLLLATYFYAQAGAAWSLFALLFLVPDVSFVGYLAGPRVGAAIYNVAHSYVTPLFVATALVIAGGELTLLLIWVAHIGFDRALGYGLKYPSAFGDTHLGRLGKPAPATPDASAVR